MRSGNDKTGGQTCASALFMTDVALPARSPLRERPSLRPLSLDLEPLSAAERRDLANALLRAAWSAVLEDTRVLLLDLFVEVDDAVLGDPA